MKSLVLYPFFLIICSFTLFGQPVNSHVGDVTVPPPNASSLGKYGDIPVSYSTGIPSVGIPIHTLQEGTLSLPISLSYHAGGLRPGEISSWVGAGWSLQTGGIISRTIQGTADEQVAGYLSRNQDITFQQVLNNQGNLVTCVEHLNDPTPIADMANGQLDGEPDIFSFSAGGYSGKFHFDVNDSIVMVPKQDVKIYYENDMSFSVSALQNFIVVLPNGTRYHFGEKANGDRVTDLSTVNASSFKDEVSWYLTRIESYDLEHEITFDYRVEEYEYNSRSANGGGVAVRGMAANQTKIEGFQLSQISTPLETINFVPGGVRSDLKSASGDKSKLLASIDIESANSNFCKQFSLGISYLFDDNAGSPIYPEDYRPILNTLTESSCALVDPIDDIPPYVFSYFQDKDDADYFPTRLTLAIDHWGYYNGAHDENTISLNIPFTKIAYVLAGGSAVESCQGSANRETNESFMKYGTLQSIRYPTGGRTLFDFEANTYFEPDGIIDLIETGNVLEGEQCSSGSMNMGVQVDDFNYTVNDLDKLRYTWVDGPVNPALNCGQTGFGRIEAWQNNTKVDEADLSNNSNEDFLELGDLLPDLVEGQTYNFRLKVVFAYSRFELLKEVLINENTNRKVGGLRIAQITNRGKIGGGIDKDVIKTFTYEDANLNTRSSGQLFNQPDYGSILYYRSTPCGSNPGQPADAIHFFTNISITPLHSFEGRHISYSNVKEYHNGIGYNQYQFFEESLPPNPSLNNNGEYEPFPRPPIQAMIDAGNTSLTATRKDNDVEVSYTINEKFADSYTTSPGTYVKAIWTPSVGNSVANYVTYKIRSKPFRLATVTSFLDGVSTVQTYDYTSATHLAPTVSTITNSNGDVTRTTSVYSFDASSSVDPAFDNSVRDAMVSKNILAPVKIETSVGGTANIVDGSRTEWALFNGSPYPATFDRYEATWNNSGVLNGSWEEKAVIGSYQDGYPTTYTKEGWDPETYTWKPSGMIESRTFNNFVWNYNYVSNTRMISSVEDVDGQEIFYEYDALMRLKQTRARNNNITTDYIYIYGDINNPSSVSTTTTFTPVTGSELITLSSSQYLDGLGRPIQTVKHDYSEDEKDVVQTTEYDEWGRPYKVYEPFEVSSTSNNGNYVPSVAGNPGFTETVYDDTPLSRTESVTSPETWHVSLYNYGNNQTSISAPDGTVYPAGSLIRQTMIDPNGNQSVSYIDKLQRQILSRQLDDNDNILTSTFTSYDDKNRVLKVYPPGASNSTPDLTYSYLYDGEDNLIAKKIPGRDALPGQDYCEQYWYDTRNLLTYTKNSAIPSSFSHIASYYDEYGRMRETGFVTTSPSGDFSTNDNTIVNVNLLSANTYGSSNIELSRIVSGKARVLSENTLGDMLAYVNVYDSYGRIQTTTGNHFLNLGNVNSQITNYVYDFADNVLREEYEHNFTSEQLKTISRTSVDHSERPYQNFHQIVRNGITNPEVQTGKITYTAKDQVDQQYLGKTASGYLQTVDFTYLKSGLLSKINDPANLQDDLFSLEVGYNQPDANSGAAPQLNGSISSLVSRTKSGTHFTYGYAYDNLNRLLSSTYYDNNTPGNGDRYGTSYTYDSRGNISTLTRSGAQSTGTSPTYGLIDNLTYNYNNNTNELTSITEAAGDAGFRAKTNGNYGYDSRGNVTVDPARDLSLAYNYLDLPYSFTLPDGSGTIKYVYSADGIKLSEIRENDSGLVYRRDYAGPATYVDGFLQYVMHPNGRVTPNPCEQELNVTGQLNGSNDYAAQKIRSSAVIESGNTLFEAQDEIVLEPNFEVQLGAAFTASIKPCDETVAWQYEYVLQDHLGNSRILFADENGNSSIEVEEILQENHYYSFGMKMHGEWLGEPTFEQRYRFNGIEHVEEIGLDMAFYRSYDPAIGRWMQIDPLAERSVDLTPYNVNYNNPISYIDPLGDEPNKPVCNKECRERKRARRAEDRAKRKARKELGRKLRKERRIRQRAHNRRMRERNTKGLVNLFVSEQKMRIPNTKEVSSNFIFFRPSQYVNGTLGTGTVSITDRYVDFIAGGKTIGFNGPSISNMSKRDLPREFDNLSIVDIVDHSELNISILGQSSVSGEWLSLNKVKPGHDYSELRLNVIAKQGVSWAIKVSIRVKLRYHYGAGRGGINRPYWHRIWYGKKFK